jgi:hypothetical protein
MGAYSTQFWGISLTEKYDKIEEAMPSLDPEKEVDDGEISELSDYVRHHQLGKSLYDGGGWGQITFIGETVQATARGAIVTDEQVERVAAIVARIPDELKAALVKVFGTLPEPSFHTEEGWG